MIYPKINEALFIIGKKRCSKCKEDLSLDLFSRNKSMKNGYAAYCKKCKAEVRKEERINKPELVKDRKKRNYEKHKEEILVKQRKYNSLDSTKSNRNKRQRERYKNDVQFRKGTQLRNNLNQIILGNTSLEFAKREVGCSPSFLKIYIESQFENWMNWNNKKSSLQRKEYFAGWVFDHINPLGNFDLSNETEYFKAAHFTNIQPLSDYVNLLKGERTNAQLTEDITNGVIDENTFSISGKTAMNSLKERFN